MPELRFGLSGCGGGGESFSPDELGRFAARAEQQGFTGLWLNEEHFQYPIEGRGRLCLSPLILAASIVARTSRIRIGFSVLLMSLHQPLRLAEDIATLDVLSQGRIDFGISRGANPRYGQAFRTDALDGVEFPQTLSFILDCWKTHDVRIGDTLVSVQPKPVQQPGPPIYIGTYSQDTVRWAAKSGLGLIQHGIQPIRHIKDLLMVYADAGGRVENVPVGRFLYVSETDRLAEQELMPVIYQLTSRLRKAGVVSRTLTEDDLDPQRFYRDMVIAGSPKTCLEKIERLRTEMGLGYINWLSAFFGYLPAELLDASLRLFAEEVMPTFIRSHC